MDQPFAGARVIEVGGTVAAGAATKTFSDYGADVIKVEPPGGGEIRRLPPFPDDRPHLETGAYHLALDTGKRSIVCDVTVPSGREVLERLCDDAVLLLLNLPPAEAEAILARLGDHGPSTVTITPHGVEGPFRDRRENDMSMFAWTSAMYRHSIVGKEPLRYAPYVATMQVSATAAAVGVAAIWGREHGGERLSIEVAGVEALAGNTDAFFTAWAFSGVEPSREAGPSKTVYVDGHYRCADGYVWFSSQGEPFFSRLCKGIGHPELPTDPRFADPEQKAQHWNEFMEYFGPWLETRTRDQVFTELQREGVLVAPVLEMPEVLADQQAVARGSYVQLEQPEVGNITLAGPPFHMPEAWEARPAPRLGEHTVELLDTLGYSRDEQMALFRAEVTA